MDHVSTPNQKTDLLPMLASLCPLDLVFLYFLNEKKIQTSYPSNVKEFERCNASWIDHLRVFKYSELAQRMPVRVAEAYPL